MVSHDLQFKETYERLKKRDVEKQLESCRKVQEVLVPLIVTQLYIKYSNFDDNILWACFCVLLR